MISGAFGACCPGQKYRHRKIKTLSWTGCPCPNSSEHAAFGILSHYWTETLRQITECRYKVQQQRQKWLFVTPGFASSACKQVIDFEITECTQQSGRAAPRGEPHRRPQLYYNKHSDLQSFRAGARIMKPWIRHVGVQNMFTEPFKAECAWWYTKKLQFGVKPR